VTALTDRFRSVAEAARFLGVEENTLRNARAGKNEPRAPLLVALSTRLNVSMNYLLGLSDDPTPPTVQGGTHGAAFGFRLVPKLDVCAAAGAGSPERIHAVAERLPFPDWMLKKLAPPEAELCFLRADGASMAPTIADGALLLVDQGEAARELPDALARADEFDAGDIYVFLIGDELRVKRLRKNAAGEIVVISDNRVHLPEVLREADLKRFEMLGRVIWWDNRL
jgi:phage repressor protein C with HTH and peptisase S24 domain